MINFPFVLFILAVVGFLIFAFKTRYISDEKRRLSETEDFKSEHGRLDSPDTMPLPDVNLRVDIDEDAAEKPGILNKQIELNVFQGLLLTILFAAVVIAINRL